MIDLNDAFDSVTLSCLLRDYDMIVTIIMIPSLQQQVLNMLHIDKLVIDYSKKYLRGICGDSLDSLKGSNYEVITMKQVNI